MDLGSGESATIIARAAILRMEKDWFILSARRNDLEDKELLCENDEQEDTGKKKYMELSVEWT